MTKEQQVCFLIKHYNFKTNIYLFIYLFKKNDVLYSFMVLNSHTRDTEMPSYSI